MLSRHVHFRSTKIERSVWVVVVGITNMISDITVAMFVSRPERDCCVVLTGKSSEWKLC